MKFLLEYKEYYKVGDVVLIEYWYNSNITCVIIKEKVNNRSYLVSHNNKYSKIFNAPDEIIKGSDIIDYHTLDSK